MEASVVQMMNQATYHPPADQVLHASLSSYPLKVFGFPENWCSPCLRTRSLKLFHAHELATIAQVFEVTAVLLT